MKAVIGLGNPEEKYAKTRHNVGFMVVAELLKREDAKVSDKFNSFFAKCGDTLYLMPKTYMNNSGRAVVDLMRFYKLAPKDIIVDFDDVSLPLGKLRFRKDGSDGGHNGIKSIIGLTGSNKFARLKVGIGPQPEGWPLENFVLGNFTHKEQETLTEVISKSADAISDFIMDVEFSKLQNKYN